MNYLYFCFWFRIINNGSLPAVRNSVVEVILNLVVLKVQYGNKLKKNMELLLNQLACRNEKKNNNVTA
jgi:hypothetical protein